MVWALKPSNLPPVTHLLILCTEFQQLGPDFQTDEPVGVGIEGILINVTDKIKVLIVLGLIRRIIMFK